MKNILQILILLTGLNSMAAAPPESFTYQGRIFKSNGVDPLEASSVSFKVQVRSPDGMCLLFEETHMRDMTGTDGIFTLIVGEGTNTNVSSLSLSQVFDNTAVKTGASSCVYSPNSGDARRIRFSYDDGTEVVSMPTDQTIRSVPYAMNAMSLDGLSKDNIIQVINSTTQAKVDQLTANVVALVNLASGANTTYAKSSDLPVTSGVLDLSGTGVKVPSAPTAPEMAVNKNYADTKVGGNSLDLTGLANGQTLIWDSVQNKWITATPLMSVTSSAVTTALGYTPMNKSGDTMAGTLNMSSNNITNAGYITMAANKYLALGNFDTASETNMLNTVLTPGGSAYAGATWYNSNSKTLKFWSGTEILDSATKVYADANIGGQKATVPALNNTTDIGKVLSWSGSGFGWMVTSLPTIPVTSVAGRTGAITLSHSDISGTTSVANGGTGQTSYADGELLIGNSSGALSKATLTAGSGMIVTNGSGSISLAVDSGTTANKILKLDASGKIPAVDGSQLTGVVASSVSGTIPAANIDTGTTANKIVKLDATGKLPALDGSQLVNLPNIPFGNVTVLDSSTTWNTSGVKRVFVQVWGAGGGGGGGTALGVAGGGGGGGAYAAGFIDVSAVSSVSITIGAGGAAGVLAAGGGDGGTTSFGAYLSASGGTGGQALAQGSASGGNVITGTIQIIGGRGGPGTQAGGVLSLTVVGAGGTGGSAGGGGGVGAGGASSASIAGGLGTVPGGGGGGGGSTVLSGSAGGAGGAGRVVIWY